MKEIHNFYRVPFYKTGSPFYKTGSPFYKIGSPFYKTGSPFYKTVSAYYTTVSAYYKTGAPFYKTRSPFYKITLSWILAGMAPHNFTAGPEALPYTTCNKKCNLVLPHIFEFMKKIIPGRGIWVSPECAVFFSLFPAVTQFVVHSHDVPFKSRKACDGKQCNSLLFVNLTRKKRIIANKNELAVDYYSTLTLKALGFLLQVQHWGVCFFTVKLDPDIPESWNFYGWQLLLCSTKYANMKDQQ